MLTVTVKMVDPIIDQEKDLDEEAWVIGGELILIFVGLNPVNLGCNLCAEEFWARYLQDGHREVLDLVVEVNDCLRDENCLLALAFSVLAAAAAPFLGAHLGGERLL